MEADDNQRVERGVYRRTPIPSPVDSVDTFHEGDRLMARREAGGQWHPCLFVSWKGRGRKPKVMWAGDWSVSFLEVENVRSMTDAEVCEEEACAEKARQAHKRAREGVPADLPQQILHGSVSTNVPDVAAPISEKRKRRCLDLSLADGSLPQSLAMPSRHNLPAYRYVMAPMVGGSELPFRMLARRFGTQLCYTPMIYSGPFSTDPAYRKSVEHGFHTCREDRPLVAHFCGNDPKVLLAAAKHISHEVDAIDLNLGCPQRVAHAGHFGSYLLDEQDRDLVCAIVKCLSDGLPIPVFCKIRLLDEVDATLRLVRQLEASGAALIAVHARYRGTPTHRRDGPAHLDQIPAIKKAVRIPILSNGNVRTWEDVLSNLESTGADGIMSAEGLLDDPCLFLPGAVASGSRTSFSEPSSRKRSGDVLSDGDSSAKLRKVEKKLRQIELLEKKQASGSKLSAEEIEKVAFKKSFQRERKHLLVDSNCAVALVKVGGEGQPKSANVAPRDGLEKMKFYLKMCETYQMPPLSTVIFHCRRIAKSELLEYQLLDDFKAAKDLAAVKATLQKMEGFRDQPETFKFDEEKLTLERELQAKLAYEECCRKKFQARMERKAARLGQPLSNFLKPTMVPGGKLQGAVEPTWLQENESG